MPCGVHAPDQRLEIVLAGQSWEKGEHETEPTDRRILRAPTRNRRPPARPS
ncbi:hypothetical protein G155_00097 [Mycobacterium sp. VKM Ac-1817D]|nr:hypothetical protein G155_00097 [Mycobacterium sp. VKM Ac-1817D]